MIQVPARNLQEWVDYIQTLHFREIELSLERVRAVYQRLYPDGVNFKIITLAGTNGKGSTAAMLSSIYRAAGYHVGKFTSPHLVDFTERYELSGGDVGEEFLLESFTRVEQARAEIPITFFEFGALLAIDLFARAEVDVAVMEVGLGGRLDAINILDADVSIITSISIDHTAWLGNTLEEIAFEKVGIARADRPCVVGIAEPANSIRQHCAKIGARLTHLNQGFSYQPAVDGQTWEWRSGEYRLTELPLPFAQSGVQLSNASTALQGVLELQAELPVAEPAIKQGLAQARVLARCQILSDDPKIILDVAHNESSVQRLADFVARQNPSGRIVAVLGMLFDKEIGASLGHFADLVDEWNFASIAGERGASAKHVEGELLKAAARMKSSDTKRFDNVVAAFDSVFAELKSGDLLVVFGSFYIAGDILRHVRGLGLVPQD